MPLLADICIPTTPNLPRTSSDGNVWISIEREHDELMSTALGKYERRGGARPPASASSNARPTRSRPRSNALGTIIVFDPRELRIRVAGSFGRHSAYALEGDERRR
jgi:hypothetical protein